MATVIPAASSSSRVLDWLAHAPIFRDLARDDLERIADYIETTYEKIGTFAIRDGSEIAIRLHKGASVVSRYGDQQWPCFAEVHLTSRR